MTAGRVCCLAARVLGSALIVASPAFAQTISSLNITPPVLNAATPQDIVLEAQTTGHPTRVLFVPGSGDLFTTIDLRDDGTGGDRQAGDGIYSCVLPAQTVLGAMLPYDIHRVLVGGIEVFNGTTLLGTYNLTIDVYASDVGTYPITRLSQIAQATNRLVNINDPTYFVSIDPTHVTKLFYQLFGDDYDFINLIFVPMRFLNRNHIQVRNSVDGIGLSHFDATAAYGSAGHLQGVSQFPIPTYFDGAENGHIHELGHQWINFLSFYPVASGIPHWPYSSMAGGVMGFSIGGSGGEGGDFACLVVNQGGVVTLNPRPHDPVYNALELYLMGLITADAVPAQTVFATQTSAPAATCNGQTFTGPVVPVTAQDVISHFGPRVPAAGQAPTRFRMATVLVTRDGLATPEQMWLYSWLADRAELRATTAIHSGFHRDDAASPFFVATGYRASLDMRIELGQPDFTLVPAPDTMTVTAGSPATFTITTTPGRVSFDNDVSFTCGALPAHFSCAFSPSHVVPGATGASTTLTISTTGAALSATDSTTSRVPMAPLVLLLCAAIAQLAGPRRARRATAAAVLGAAIGLAVSCGGGANVPASTTSTTTTNTTPTTTPPATSSAMTNTITVSGTSNGQVRNTAVVVLVK